MSCGATSHPALLSQVTCQGRGQEACLSCDGNSKRGCTLHPNILHRKSAAGEQGRGTFYSADISLCGQMDGVGEPAAHPGLLP